MPRFVRPAWMIARADGRKSAVALGPRSLDGTLTARITLRNADATVSRPIELAALLTHPLGRPEGDAILMIDVPSELLGRVIVNGSVVDRKGAR